jgi:sulfatase maturation enzyme AslB (radical SAM superfamily)
MSFKKIELPKSYNYIACFLTFECNLKCEYCINYFGNGSILKKAVIPGEKWVQILNRLDCASDLPVTFQGGEPALHPDFIWIIKNLRKSLNIDILSNLNLNVDEFIDSIEPDRLSRKAPYPNIRVSYHPQYMNLDELIKKVLKMQNAGFSIGIFAILHPEFKQVILEAQGKCRNLGIDFRTKEFLGVFNGQLYGSYFYPQAVGNVSQKSCLCKTTELIIDPEGNAYRCHHDLYRDHAPLGSLLEPSFEINDVFRECGNFGDCNPCDIKIKTNRFQVYGHASMEIKDIK